MKQRRAIYPVHVLTLLLVVGIGVTGAWLHVAPTQPEKYAVSALPANLLLMQAWGVLGHDTFNVPSWSISAEWLVYLCTPLLFFVARRNSYLLSAAMILIFMVTMGSVRSAAGMRDWSIATYDFGALRAVPSFFAGILTAKFVERLPVLEWPKWWMAHGAFITILLMMQLGARPEFVIWLFAGLIALAAACEKQGNASWITGALAERLGQASYSIYMLHMIFYVPIALTLRKFGQIGTPVAGFAALLLYIGSVAVAMVTFKYFENPSRYWLIGRLNFIDKLLDKPPRLKSRASPT